MEADFDSTASEGRVHRAMTLIAASLVVIACSGILYLYPAVLALGAADGKAAPVLAYLKTLEGAADRPTDKPMAPDEIDALVGVYVFGPKPADAFEVARRKGGGMPGQLTVQRLEAAPRNLFHLGDRVFQPAGAEAVRLRFSIESPAKTLTLLEPLPGTTATRKA